MERTVFPLAVLCLVLSGASALQVSIPEAEYEFTSGDNITLPCSFTPKNSHNSLVIITWSVDGDKPRDPESQVLVHYFPMGLTDIKSKYEGRMSLDKDISTGKANLKLSPVTLVDNRRFKCRVDIPGDDQGKLSDSTRVLVQDKRPKVSDLQDCLATCLKSSGWLK